MQSETADYASGAVIPANSTKQRLRSEVRLVLPPGELELSDSGPFALLCENVTSSTKPEVHNNLAVCRQRRNGRSTATVTCTENFAKFGYVVFETCELIDRETDRQTNRHTDMLIAIFRLRVGGEVNMGYVM